MDKPFFLSIDFSNCEIKISISECQWYSIYFFNVNYVFSKTPSTKCISFNFNCFHFPCLKSGIQLSINAVNYYDITL